MRRRKLTIKILSLPYFLCTKIEAFKNRGRITPPITKDKEKYLNYFKEAKKLQAQIQKIIPECKNLSMGMSNDYITAISYGSTYIRIGTKIFGERK